MVLDPRPYGIWVKDYKMTISPYVVERKRTETPLWAKNGTPLRQLDLELTERCNSNCIHCCINRPADDAWAVSHEMTTKQINDLLRQAADLGCLQVRFTGGEPLLRPDFEDIYLYSRRLGLKVLLFTNGRLLTPDLANLFAHIPLLVPIEITVYGMHRESYEAVTRVPGSFAEFRGGLDRLLERQVPFVVKSVILPQNRAEMAEFEAWARTLPGMDRPPAYAMSLELRNRRDSAVKNATIASLRLPAQEVLSVLTRNPDGYRRDLSEFAARFLKQPHDRLFSCGAGRSVCVDAYGRAQPCMGLRAPELSCNLVSGTVNAAAADAQKKNSTGLNLAEALVRFQKYREMRAQNPEYLRRCARCFLRGLCEQCPAKSWTEHGHLDTPVEYLCEIAHAQARYLGWLGEDEYAWEVMAWQERITHDRKETSSLEPHQPEGTGKPTYCP